MPSDLINAVAGTFAGGFSSVLFHPINVLQTRFQGIYHPFRFFCFDHFSDQI